MCSKVLEPQFSKLGLGQGAALGPKNWELAQPSRHPLGRGARWSGSYGNTDAGIPKSGPAARNVGDGGLACAPALNLEWTPWLQAEAQQTLSEGKAMTKLGPQVPHETRPSWEPPNNE